MGFHLLTPKSGAGDAAPRGSWATETSSPGLQIEITLLFHLIRNMYGNEIPSHGAVEMSVCVQTSASVYQDFIGRGGDPSCSRLSSFSGSHCNLSGNLKLNLILASSYIM